ncbi:SpoIIE family protein phosphatase [Streptomyces sp. RPT161]|uniref:SpoIIE family protein phosphatase n=1 Tax=Streptomyces sp. RPT161 TaxID=3015993 RepID=UPI0022B87DDB|nr:SpoIIE family protein phosphatase [Streptomyces sp. RPT161]
MARDSRSAAPGSGTDAIDQGVRQDLDALLARLDAARDRLGCHIAALYVPGPDAERLELVMMLGLSREFVRPWEHVPLSTTAPVTDAMRDRRLVWVGGEEAMVRLYPALALVLPYAFSLAALPLVADGAALGVVFTCWPGWHSAELSETEHDALMALSADLARLLRDATAAGRPVRAGPEPLMITAESGGPGTPESLTAMVERLPEGICALDARGRLTWVTPRAANLLGAPVFRLLGARPWDVLPWLRDPVYEDRYRAATVSRQISSFVALRPPDRWLAFRLYPDASGITVRINEADVAPRDAPGPMLAADAEVPTRAGAYYHILHLASKLTQAVGVVDVVDLVADQIVPSFGARAVAVLIAEGDRLLVAGHRGYPPGLIDAFDSTPLTAATPGVHALVSGAPAFFESREELERMYPVRPQMRDTMSAWAYLPLVASGRLVGTCVLAFDQPHHFTVHERAVLTSLSGLIAQAMDRARMYDAKLELAHGLQESLLPHALPLLPGLETAARYLPGTEGMDIGGDFYDILRIDRGTAGAVIGDVQGHNVAAAALMGQIRTAVRAYATAGADPGSVLSQTNRLMNDLDTNLLASCIYLRVHLSGRYALLASAGHPRPLLRTPDGEVRVPEVAGGIVLGAEAVTSYPLTRIPMPVGTVLALYTDGLIEAPGVDLDDALHALGGKLARFDDGPLDALADALTRNAEQARHRTDDIAVLLLRSVCAERDGALA